ncbi:MAG: hypothetical protein IIC56_08485 [Proteobacteria bacterium]|nr:hypothetical protein [Pseudomonadota bacterium]
MEVAHPDALRRIQDAGEQWWVWEAIKPIRGSQKSVAYTANLLVNIWGKNRNTGKLEWCEFGTWDFTFEGELKDGKPVEIGWDDF